MARFSALILALFAASAQAFTTGPSLKTHVVQHTPLKLMTPEEVDKVMGQASECAEGECSIDDVTELISILMAQQKELSERVDKVKSMIKSLDEVNVKEGREVDEVRETVRALFRVFQLGDSASGNDYPSLSRATGWSGDVGDGPKTAYDALPPKPYKKSSS